MRYSEAPSVAIAFYRLLYATALLSPVALLLARRELAELSGRDWVGLGLVGAVLAVHFAAWISSLSLTSVASSVFLVTLHPVFVAFASHRLYGEGVAKVGFAGIVLALVGGLVIVVGDAGGGANPLLGDLLAFGGGIAAAVYFLAGRGYRRRLGLVAYVTPVYASASLFLALFLVLLPAPHGGPVLGYPLREHLIFLALAVVPMILGHTILNWALRYVTAPIIATTILGEPIGASLLALLLLGEAPGVSTLLGGGLVLAGIALVALTTPPPPAEASAEAA